MANPIPLVVDVDGTLIRTDLLHEAAFDYVAKRPLQAWNLVSWLIGGKARLKSELAKKGDFDPSAVPIRPETEQLIRDAQAEGRPVYLASASHGSYVQAIADRIGGLAGVFATDDDVNLAGASKAQRLIEAFGEKGFDYVGDAAVDRPVWRAARKALAVTHSEAFERSVLQEFPDAEIVARPRFKLKPVVKMLRPHQWAKNVLVFLPLLLGHFFTVEAVVEATIAFVCFSMAASSAYILNDLLDIDSDRAHHRKRKRPVASGDLKIIHAIPLVPLLLIGAGALATALPPRFMVFLAAYYVLTLAYSLVIKRKVLIDVIVLGGLYTLRVLGGVEAISAVKSPWLLMFSLFLFTSLALVKRCGEIIAQGDATGPIKGRGYLPVDLRALMPCACASAFGAVFVAALYLSSPEMLSLYAHPLRLWLVCPVLLFWICRVLVLCNRGELHDDPVVFALTDRTSWACGVAVLAVILASL